MKKFLVLALIYSLNIMIFLFAKSAGAQPDITRSPAIECVKLDGRPLVLAIMKEREISR